MAEDSALFTLKIDAAGSGNVVEQFIEVVKELIQTKQQLSEAEAENEKQIKATEEALKKQEEAINKNKEALKAEEGSISKLREENRKLTAERNALSTKTEEGRQKIKALNEQINANNKTIKENVDALSKQRLNIGNYSLALETVIPGIGKFTAAIEGTTRAGLTFIATPIGIILAALAVILATVTAYFKGSEEGGDKWAKVMAQASAVVKVLTDRIIQVGDAIVSFFSGDWSEAADKMAGAFKGIGDEMARELELAGMLADALDELEEKELAQSIAVSKTSNEIKQLLIQAKARNITERERIELYNQALEMERKQAAENEAIALRKLELAAIQLQMDFSQFESERKKNESAIDFTMRLLANESILMDRRKEVADLLIKYNQVQGESLVIQEKILVKQNEAADRERENAEKAKEAEEKRLDALRKRQTEVEKMNRQAEINEQEQIAIMKAGDQEIIDAHQEYATRSVEISVEEAREKERIRQEDLAAELKAMEDKRIALQATSDFAMNLLAGQSKTQQMTMNADVSVVRAGEQAKLRELELRFKRGEVSEEAYNRQRNQIMSDSDNQERQLKKKGFESQKKNQIAATVISTLQSGVNAYQSLSVIPIVGPVLGALAAAAALVFGYQQVDAIRRTEFTYATGGISGTKIMPHHGKQVYRSNGDNLIATVKTGEVILNEKQQAALGGAKTFAAIGVPGFATGGFTGGSIIETQFADRNFETSRRLDRIADSVENIPRQVLVLQDFEAVQGAKNSVEVKATS